MTTATEIPRLKVRYNEQIRDQLKESLALGNIMGSNIYNILGIAGCTGLVSPTTVPPEIVRYDNLVMLGATLAMVAMARTGYRLSRIEGALLVLGYVAYTASLWPK